MIVLGKIFLYQNLSWMPTRDPFLLPYIAYIKSINNLDFYHNTDHAVYRLDVCQSYLLCTI